MSVITCSPCGAYVDTDFDTDGIWPLVDHNSGPDFICASCVDEMEALELLNLGYDPDTLEPLDDDGMVEAFRLVEAAPHLLDSLKNLVNGIETGAVTSDHDETFANAIQYARNSIKIATGERIV